MKAIPNKMRGYAIGQQDFRVLREDGAIYVDKTTYIEKLINSQNKYFFLARPRRFGKSLFLSTLRYFFEGKRELFKGLAIDSTDWGWHEYPVLYLDLNTDRYIEKGKLAGVLDAMFNEWEKKYNIEEKYDDLPQRFRTIIKRAHEHTGHKVVILIDEYDKPLVGNLNKKENLDHYRAELASLYSNFKSSAEHIRMVFLTGVSRFSKLSVFSDLNNINDITFDTEFADICGITEYELSEYFQEGIEQLSHTYAVSFDEAVKILKRHYDGYKFAGTGSDIYNPWALLNCLSKQRIGNYWNETGLPTIVAESLKRIDADLELTFNAKCREDELKGMDLLNPNPIALLYQTGYLTIKRYNTRLGIYHLGIPNREVERGIYDILLPYYISTKRVTPNRVLLDIVEGFVEGNPQQALRAMQTFFASIDYKLKIDNENNFHNAFYLLTHILGLDTQTEVHTSDGSIDIIINTDEYLYIIELKYDHTAEEALRQIVHKQYARPWQTDAREVVLIGVEFSSKTRCIEDWKIKTPSHKKC